MLFNSFEFIFVFMPITLLGFYVLGALSRDASFRWLILASFCFYAWWRPLNVLIIAPSILVNYLLARVLLRLAADEQRRRLSIAILLLGIAFNVAFLGYFKYTDFIRTAINDAAGADLALLHIVLPLGISFITFQKIAFLIDVQAGRVRSFSLQDYCLFVLFFPQLIAGPIVHYREMMPQFHSAPARFSKENVSVGLTLFLVGLVKKDFFADSLSPLVSPIFERASGGESVSLLSSWMAAVGFTLQIYFDFSGYSDMAIGIARFFGIRLPANFDSPLQASSIIDFWLRWHMTLTRFLTAYIYNPLVLTLTRQRLAHGRPGFGGRNTTVGAFVELLMLPTLLTMFVSGLWHGAGYLFVLWGLLHGVFLTVNHGWRLLATRLWHNKARYARVMRPVGGLLTFLSVAVAMVLFRSTTVGAAVDLLKGMAGVNGITLPAQLYASFGPAAHWLQAIGVHAAQESAHDFALLLVWIAVLLVIVLGFPNTLQITAAYEPALGMRRQTGTPAGGARAVEWNASLAWAMAMTIVAAIGIYQIGGQSEFLYWQF
jgi:alginate O-acetyltransferase complex protein AlgI